MIQQIANGYIAHFIHGMDLINIIVSHPAVYGVAWIVNVRFGSSGISTETCRLLQRTKMWSNTKVFW